MLIKAAALVYVGVLVFPSLGPMAVYHLQKKLIRKEVKKQIIMGIPLGELAAFRGSDVTGDKVRWMNEREFVIDGMYYDVVKRIETDSGEVVYCWPDFKESDLERVRTESAMAMLDVKQGKKPSEFVCYQIFIKGFYKDISEIQCFVYWYKNVYPADLQMVVVSVSHGLFHPPECQMVYNSVGGVRISLS